MLRNMKEHDCKGIVLVLNEVLSLNAQEFIDSHT